MQGFSKGTRVTTESGSERLRMADGNTKPILTNKQHTTAGAYDGTKLYFQTILWYFYTYSYNCAQCSSSYYLIQVKLILGNQCISPKNTPELQGYSN